MIKEKGFEIGINFYNYANFPVKNAAQILKKPQKA